MKLLELLVQLELMDIVTQIWEELQRMKLGIGLIYIIFGGMLYVAMTWLQTRNLQILQIATVHLFLITLKTVVDQVKTEKCS